MRKGLTVRKHGANFVRFEFRAIFELKSQGKYETRISRSNSKFEIQGKGESQRQLREMIVVDPPVIFGL